MFRYTKVVPYSHSLEPPPSFPAAFNSSGTPEHQAREASLSETAFASRAVSSSRVFEAITIKDHAKPLTLAQAPATFSGEARSSSTTTGTRSASSPEVLALGGLSTRSVVEHEITSSPQLTEITAVSSTVGSSTGSTVQPSLRSSTSGTVPAQSPTADPVNIRSARTNGIIIGSVLGGAAVLLFVTLAIVYLAWRRRRERRDQTERGDTTQQQTIEATGVTGNNDDVPEERKGSIDSPMTLPFQGVTTQRPIDLRSEPIINDISPITPIMPHLSRWTSEKAYIPSPAGQPSIIDTQPHLRYHPLFSSARHDGNDDDDRAHVQHQPDDVSPCSSTSSSPLPRPLSQAQAQAQAAAEAEAEAEAEAQALASFLFFDSPSSRSSRRPSTRDSSAPCTALSVPPPLHRGPPPRRRHTRAGGQGGGFAGPDGAGGVADLTRQPSPPPPLPARNAARSKSLRDAERPAAWI